MGVSRYLKKKDPNICIVGLPTTDGSHIPGIRKWPETYLQKFLKKKESTNYWSGWSWCPYHVEAACKREAIFSGMSSGGAAHAASKLSPRLSHGVIVFYRLRPRRRVPVFRPVWLILNRPFQRKCRSSSRLCCQTYICGLFVYILLVNLRQSSVRSIVLWK